MDSTPTKPDLSGLIMTDIMIEFVFRILEASAIIVVPPLIIAVIIGLVVAILQTATHINDQCFPQIVKMVVICLVLFVSGVSLSIPFTAATRDAFSFATIVPGKTNGQP